MTPHKDEWEEEFDGRMTSLAHYGGFYHGNKNGVELYDFDNIKSFITQLLASQKKVLVEKLEGRMEKYAELEHVRWAKWQNYLHSHLTWNNDIQAWVLPHEWKDRWQMQINKPYEMLSEKEKESDREQVRPYIKDFIALIQNNDTV